MAAGRIKNERGEFIPLTPRKTRRELERRSKKAIGHVPHPPKDSEINRSLTNRLAFTAQDFDADFQALAFLREHWYQIVPPIVILTTVLSMFEANLVKPGDQLNPTILAANLTIPIIGGLATAALTELAINLKRHVSHKTAAWNKIMVTQEGQLAELESAKWTAYNETIDKLADELGITRGLLISIVTGFSLKREYNQSK